jgi:hypothetical protein
VTRGAVTPRMRPAMSAAAMTERRTWCMGFT